jgi:DNA polymerase
MENDDLGHALALLARGLQGAIEVAGVAGVAALPRPHFASAAAAPAVAAPAAPAAAPAAPARSLAAVPTTTTPAAPANPRTPTTTTTTTTTTVPAVPAASPLSALASADSNADKLRILCDDVIGDCTRCKLHRGRNKLVFGVGNPHARLVFVGEGPGADEDREGIPFVGRAGQLLTKMIGAMGLARDDVYICNVVKCRPPNNRDPEADEVDACEAFLKAQLAVLSPTVIVGLGRCAVHTLLRTQTPISRLRGHWQTYEGIALMPTYHPSYLLREERDPSQARKREAWSDLQQVMKRLSTSTP